MNLFERDPKLSNFHCSTEYHLAQTRSLVNVVVYELAYRLSAESGVFSGSADEVASYFEFHPKAVSQSYRDLTGLGHFIELRNGAKNFETNEYRVVKHSEWAESHPGTCRVKEDFGWDVIPLGQQMFAVSGRKIKLRAFEVNIFLKTGLPPALILERWRTFLNDNRNQPKAWRKSAAYLFWQHLQVEIPRMAEVPVGAAGGRK